MQHQQDLEARPAATGVLPAAGLMASALFLVGLEIFSHFDMAFFSCLAAVPCLAKSILVAIWISAFNESL